MGGVLMAAVDQVVLTIDHSDHSQSIPWAVVEEHLSDYLAGGAPPPGTGLSMAPGMIRLVVDFTLNHYQLPLFDPTALRWVQGLLDTVACLQGAAPAEPAEDLLANRVAAARQLFLTVTGT